MSSLRKVTMPAPLPGARIDPEKFKYLRATAGLSTSAFRTAGLTTIALLSIESGMSGRMTLQMAGTAAHLIGAPLAEVLDEGDVTGLVGPVGDAVQLESLLFNAKGPTRWDTISAITAWDRPRIRAAVAALKRELTGRGLAVSDGPGWCMLRSSVAAPTWGVVRATDRQMLLRRGLTHPEVCMLYEVLRADLEETSQLEATSNNKRVALAKLINAGAVVASEDQGRGVVAEDQITKNRLYGRVHLSEDVRYAFEPLLTRRTRHRPKASPRPRRRRKAA